MWKDENIVTWFFMFAALLSVVAWGSLTLDFQKRCEAACYPARSITPVYDFQETCFCDEGHGKWRKEDINN